MGGAWQRDEIWMDGERKTDKENRDKWGKYSRIRKRQDRRGAR